MPRGTAPLTLALWHVGDPGNVGTLVRTADAFGAGVALSSGSADPTGPKALRAPLPAPSSACRSARSTKRRARWIALVARGGTDRLRVLDSGHGSFVLGAEREGLPAEVLARCDTRATITLAPASESLNVAAAGAIALYQARQR